MYIYDRDTEIERERKMLKEIQGSVVSTSYYKYIYIAEEVNIIKNVISFERTLYSF